MIKVVRGNPTPEELAAALAVVQARTAALASAVQGSAPAPADAWSDPARVARHRLPQPGPQTWARTYWPG
ncbi:acyl-CoA carboxylase epsilon subunit [Streptomyces sp. B-S-A8]|uniref:Acyl-CoA carboxylase epsilon subunit n=1 Tax=Streptomyces solicavernae TaxID=3043614 RepID=A0ABT6S1L2_9ACTN|nr:acyl-CoA carboxylase epsilon subunit [Streptomyces sp. B-S-A8]MDI3390586.1 acyl-CoA carboxylase epsilon subunit [Streptomyces sp. B-S-A8]